jgi:tight adherence protein B
VSTALTSVVTAGGAVCLCIAAADGRRRVGASRVRRRLPVTGATPPKVSALHALAARLGRRRQVELADRGLPSWLEASARAARAGASLRQALRDGASTVATTPVGVQLGPFVTALDRGVALDIALDLLDGDRVSSGRSIVCRALRLAASVGGPSAAVLDAVSATLHERAALAREVRALSTQARLSALVMVCAPVVFGLGAMQLDRRVGAFFVSGPGVLCVLGGLALDLAGALWMARIVRPDA